MKCDGCVHDVVVGCTMYDCIRNKDKGEFLQTVTFTDRFLSRDKKDEKEDTSCQ